MACRQCHIYSVSLVGNPNAADLLQVYHAYHTQCSFGDSLSRFRCLDCGEEGPPVLPRFECALCGGARVVAVGPTRKVGSESGGESEDRSFAARLQGDVELDVLRETLRMNGMPPSQRGACWRLLLRYDEPDKATRAAQMALFRRKYYYWKARYCRDESVLTAAQRDTRQQIGVDVPRTSCRSHPAFFEEPLLAEALARVLFVWGVVCFEQVGYFQGLNDLCTPLFVLLCDGRPPLHDPQAMAELEADVCWCLALLLEPVVRATRGKMHAVEFTKVEEAIARAIDPELCRHLEEVLAIDWMFFSFKWNICLFARELPLALLFTLWDYYLLQSEWGFADFHVYCVVALLQTFRAELLTFEDTTEALLFLQHLPVQEWDDREVRNLIARATRIRQQHGSFMSGFNLGDTSPVELLKQRPLTEEFHVL